MLVEQLKVAPTETPETSIESFFPFRTDENGAKALTTPLGQHGKGIPSETNGVTASPVSTLTQSITLETNSTNSSSQLAVSKKKPSKITPSKNDKNNLARNDTSETSSSTKTRNEMESEETPDHLTGKRAEPGSRTKGAT